MARSGIARRYADAAFDVAKEQNAVDAWSRDLTGIRDTMVNTGLGTQLESAKTPFDAKVELLRAVFPGMNEKILNLLFLVVQRGRIAVFPLIVDEFNALNDEYNNRARGEVTTAVPLDDAERQFIESRLSAITGKTVTVTTKVDPEILGGFIARIGDTVLDGSSRTRLEALRRRIAG